MYTHYCPNLKISTEELKYPHEVGTATSPDLLCFIHMEIRIILDPGVSKKEPKTLMVLLYCPLYNLFWIFRKQ